MKRVIFLLLLLSLPFVLAEEQAPGLNSTPFIGEIQKTQDIIDQERYQYLGEQWRQVFLQNPVIAFFDNLFMQMNVLFVILFGRSYGFSLELFFAFVIWLFTLFSIKGYLEGFSDNKWIQYGGALALTVIIAQTQLFNVIAHAIFKFIYYKYEWWWSLLTLLIVVVLCFVYLQINKILSHKIKMAKEANKKKKLEHDVDVLEEFSNTMRKAGK